MAISPYRKTVLRRREDGWVEDGTEMRPSKLVRLEHRSLVLKEPAGTYYTGMARPRGYSPIMFKVYAFDSDPAIFMETGILEARLVVSFPKSL